MSAPERIWAKSDQGFEGIAGTWLDESDGPDMHPYILATPSSLAQAPEVVALIEAAVERERARRWKAKEGESSWPKCIECGDEARSMGESLCQECGDRAYEIWKEDEERAAAIRTPDAPASADAGRAG